MHQETCGARVEDGHDRLATWAELTCPFCGGKRRLIALITDGKVVRAILAHLGLPTTASVLAPARSTPELEFSVGAARSSALAPTMPARAFVDTPG